MDMPIKLRTKIFMREYKKIIKENAKNEGTI